MEELVFFLMFADAAKVGQDSAAEWVCEFCTQIHKIRMYIQCMCILTHYQSMK